MDVLRFAEYKTYNEAEIMALYSSVGWSNYTNNPAMLRTVYKNSLYVLAAYADGKLVGILRAVGDGASVVFLQDLIVLPEFQRHGIGSHEAFCQVLFGVIDAQSRRKRESAKRKGSALCVFSLLVRAAASS